MTLAQLEAVVWLSRLGNFRKAARLLGITQPAISLRIRQIELELGIILFKRGATSTQLTESGRQLIAYAVGITSLASQLARRATEVGHAVEDQTASAAPPTSAPSLHQ